MQELGPGSDNFVSAAAALPSAAHSEPSAITRHEAGYVTGSAELTNRAPSSLSAVGIQLHCSHAGLLVSGQDWRAPVCAASPSEGGRKGFLQNPWCGLMVGTTKVTLEVSDTDVL